VRDSLAQGGARVVGSDAQVSSGYSAERSGEQELSNFTGPEPSFAKREDTQDAGGASDLKRDRVHRAA
jgi:hypothetical protein